MACWNAKRSSRSICQARAGKKAFSLLMLHWRIVSCSTGHNPPRLVQQLKIASWKLPCSLPSNQLSGPPVAFKPQKLSRLVASVATWTLQMDIDGLDEDCSCCFLVVLLFWWCHHSRISKRQLCWLPLWLTPLAGQMFRYWQWNNALKASKHQSLMLRKLKHNCVGGLRYRHSSCQNTFDDFSWCKEFRRRPQTVHLAWIGKSALRLSKPWRGAEAKRVAFHPVVAAEVRGDTPWRITHGSCE